MKKSEVLCKAVFVCVVSGVALCTDLWAEVPEASIHVSDKVLHNLSPSPDLIGFNLEDLCNQTYGGIDSQLLHGQDFEEQVDVSDLLPMTAQQKKYVYLRRMPGGDVNLVTYGVERGDKKTQFGSLRVDVTNRALPLEQFAADVAAAIRSRISGERQLNYYWRAITNGTARAKFTLTTEKTFNGLQDQQVEFVSGNGEIGFANSGLFRRGIRFEAGKACDGFLRLRSDVPQDLFVSLRDANGKLLAEKVLRVGETKIGLVRGFEKVAFELIPSESTMGSFAVTLKTPGVITLGYAFLEPGVWGRYAGLPLKKELVEAIQGMGPRVIRYNGDMISREGVKDTYLWKNMIGPRDLRIPYAGSFNPFASHGFGIFEFLDMANTLGVIGVVGIRSDETPLSYLELIEYANGAAGTKWGDLRAKHGHPEPYGLKYIGFGNEEGGRSEQLERFKAVAKVVWAQYPEVVFVMGDSWVVGDNQIELDKSFAADQHIGGKVAPTAELLRFAKALGKDSQLWWDLHFRCFDIPKEHFLYTSIAPVDGIMGALRFREEVLKLAPDCMFNLALLEENGSGSTMYRALGHVRNQHAIMRYGGDKIVASCAANTLQADGLDLVWGQGRIFFNEKKVWFQPPYYVGQMISSHWAPQVLECEYSSRGSHINALARKTADNKALIVTVANFDGNPVQAAVQLAGFDLRASQPVAIETLAAETLYGINTADNPLGIAPKSERRQVEFHDSTALVTFEGFSFTLLRFELK